MGDLNLQKSKGTMDILLLLGRAAGLGGMLLCLVAAAVRLAGGGYYLWTFQLVTLLQAGIAALVVGCFLLLLVLTTRVKADGAGRSRQ